MPKSTNKEWLAGRNKFLTGWCSQGWCEGTRPKTGSGNPAPVCKMHTTCPCTCHEQLDKMYADLGMERIEPLTNPEYKPDFGGFVMPDTPIPTPEPVPSNGIGTLAHELVEVMLDAPAAPRVTTVLPPTPTGVRHRGQLEYEVLLACKRLLVGGSCTPQDVANEIVRATGGATPSTGAIQAVWDRWEKMGIGTQAKKPVRFTGWAGNFQGTAVELDRIKAERKRAQKRAQSAQARGFR